MESKDRRKFLGEAATLVSLSFLPAELFAQGEKLEALKGGPAWSDLGGSIKVMEWNPVELADGQEFSCTLSVHGAETRAYVRRIDAGKTYCLFHYSVFPDGKIRSSVCELACAAFLEEPPLFILCVFTCIDIWLGTD
jgi:hypothetical protein